MGGGQGLGWRGTGAAGGLSGQGSYAASSCGGGTCHHTPVLSTGAALLWTPGFS